MLEVREAAALVEKYFFEGDEGIPKNTKAEWEPFFTGTLWRELETLLKYKIVTIWKQLESCPNFNDIRFMQGYLSAIKWVIDMENMVGIDSEQMPEPTGDGKETENA